MPQVGLVSPAESHKNEVASAGVDANAAEVLGIKRAQINLRPEAWALRSKQEATGKALAHQPVDAGISKQGFHTRIDAVHAKPLGKRHFRTLV